MINIKHGHCLLIHGSSVFLGYILDLPLPRYQKAVTMFYLRTGTHAFDQVVQGYERAKFSMFHWQSLIMRRNYLMLN